MRGREEEAPSANSFRAGGGSLAPGCAANVFYQKACSMCFHVVSGNRHRWLDQRQKNTYKLEFVEKTKKKSERGGEQREKLEMFGC